MHKLISGILDAMQPNARRGRPPQVRPCPFCGASFSKTQLRKHQPACQEDFRNAPPQDPAHSSSSSPQTSDAPQQPSEFAQDGGSRFNPDGTFPQT